MMNLRLHGWFLMLLLLTCDSVALAQKKAVNLARTSYFRVKKIEGTASSRAPFALNWSSVRKGMALPFGTSLRINADTKLELAYFFRNQGDWKSAQSHLFFNTETTVILNAELMRQIELRKYFFSSLRFQKDATPEINPEEEMDFDRAWRRLAAFFNPRDIARYAEQLAGRPPSDIDIALRSKKITLLYPEDGITKFAQTFPATLQLIWAHPTAKPLEYKIYLWQHQTTYKYPYAITESNNHAITINQPGSYYVQVTSMGDMYSTKPTMVHVFPEIPEFSHEGVAIDSRIHLTQPPDGAVYFIPTAGKKLRFMGDYPHQARVTAPVLKIMKERAEKPQVVRLRGTRKLDYSLTLSPGVYEWWLEFETVKETTGEDGKVSRETKLTASEKRLLELIPNTADRRKELHRLVESNIASGGHTRIFLPLGSATSQQ